MPARYVTEPATQTTAKCDDGYKLAYPAYNNYLTYSTGGTFNIGEPKGDVNYDHKAYNYVTDPIQDKVCIKETDQAKGHD